MATIEEEAIDAWWFDTSVQRRVTPWGPIISDIHGKDAAAGGFALLGHEDADEITALLRMNQASDLPGPSGPAQISRQRRCAICRSVRGYRADFDDQFTDRTQQPMGYGCVRPVSRSTTGGV